MRHNEKSENIARGRRLLVVASQTVGVVAVHRPHRRPNPFISGQSFHFQKTGALGDTMLIPLSLTVRVLRREQISTSATRRANREEKNMVKEKMKSVAAKRRGRYSTETVGEIETRPFGNDSVATAGLLPWLTYGR